jgi:hypothetical protein
MEPKDAPKRPPSSPVMHVFSRVFQRMADREVGQDRAYLLKLAKLARLKAGPVK